MTDRITTHARLRFRLLASASLALTLASNAAMAQTTEGQGSQKVDEIVVVARAVHVSPSAVPLDKTQPTSNIQKEFIENNIIPLASFDDIVKFSPSVADQSPNGPGLGKSETLSLRGFQDGQFNVTFDGIPFGDATDFHHTSSALFLAHDIGQAQIDRGPGSAETIGDATFGGTMNFITKAPLKDFTVNPYGTYGSFNTKAIGVELDTGKHSDIGQAFFDIQSETSDGYLTNAAERRTNVMFKDILELNDRVTVTAEASYNHAFEYTTQGTTLANIQANGPNFSLNNNPKTQSFYGYQPSDYNSDFDYINVKAKLGAGWTMDNTIYTDSFGHDYTESKDASDTNPADNKVKFYNAAGASISAPLGSSTHDVPGKLTEANFRAVGDTLRFSDELPFGTLKTGLWIDYNQDFRWSESTDLTTGNVPTGTSSGTPYSYYIRDTLKTIQPYVEMDWNVTSKLTVTPGVRYSNFQRTYDALVNKTATLSGLHEPASYQETFQSVQPSVAAHYTLQTGWTAYAQVAEGFLAPPINVLEVTTAAPPSVKPEETWNYQAGTAFRRGHWVLGSRLIHSQKATMMARATPERKLSASLS
jgi:iron complex outermembrane receptor protein